VHNFDWRLRLKKPTWAIAAAMLDHDSGHSVDLQKYVRTPVVKLVRIGHLDFFVVATKFQNFSDRAWRSRNRCLNGLRGNDGFWIDLDLWLRRCWRSNSLTADVSWCWRYRILAVSGRRRSKMRRKFTGWCGRLWTGKFRRTVLIRLIWSNGVICCWCWRDTLPTLFATWRLCNLCASFDKSGLLALGNRKRIMLVCVNYTS